jgi:hypothetical protein
MQDADLLLPAKSAKITADPDFQWLVGAVNIACSQILSPAPRDFNPVPGPFGGQASPQHFKPIPGQLGD